MKKDDTCITYHHEDWEVQPAGFRFWGYMTDDGGELLEHFYYLIPHDFAATIYAECESDDAALVKLITYAMHARGYYSFNILTKEGEYL